MYSFLKLCFVAMTHCIPCIKSLAYMYIYWKAASELQEDVFYGARILLLFWPFIPFSEKKKHHRVVINL